jgi:hypothetical protein
VRQLPAALPRTVRAADDVRRSGRLSDAQRQAGDLLQALAAVECGFAVGGQAGVPAGLLRDLVIITAGLAGRTWLEADPQRVADFTALYSTPLPPPLAELDRILADVLASRFGHRSSPHAVQGSLRVERVHEPGRALQTSRTA